MFAPFRVLWALAELFDLLCFPGWIFEPVGILLFVATMAVLFRPFDLRCFALMCSMNVLYVIALSPETPNHFLLRGFANLTIVCVLARHGLRHTSASQRDAVIFEEITAILRLELYALYFFAVLHKLNWDFFQPSTSCAVQMLGELSERIPIVPSGSAAGMSSIWGTILIESSIPILLFRPPWRRFGILLAFGFHFVLAFHPAQGIYGFTFLIYALLTLFFHDDFGSNLRSWFESSEIITKAKLTMRGVRSIGIRFILIAAVVATLAAVAFWFGVFDPRGRSFSGLPMMVGFALWVPCVIAFGVAVCFFGSPPTPQGVSDRRLWRAARTPVVLVLVPLFLNCVAPYFGFHTARCFSMFSNLRTEGGKSNHLFIPVSLQFGRYQRDLVEIVSSSDRYLQYNAQRGELIPYFELRRRAWNHGDHVLVTYRRAGSTYTVDTRDPKSAERLPPVGWLAGKVMIFRGVDPTGPCSCRW